MGISGEGWKEGERVRARLRAPAVAAKPVHVQNITIIQLKKKKRTDELLCAVEHAPTSERNNVVDALKCDLAANSSERQRVTCIKPPANRRV